MAPHSRWIAGRAWIFAALASIAATANAADMPQAGEPAALQAAFAKALTAERCALLKPYLNPIYKMPASETLIRTRDDAAALGFDEALTRTKRLWEASEPDLAHECPPGGVDETYEYFSTAVRAFDQSLGQTIEQLLTRPIAPPDTSSELVKALVEQRWGREWSDPEYCNIDDEPKLSAEERPRYERVRARALRLRRRDVEAADKRFSLEEAKWYRDHRNADLGIGCSADRLHDADDEVELLLVDLSRMPAPVKPANLGKDLAEAAHSERCLLEEVDFRADDRAPVHRRRLDRLAKLFERWGWKDGAALWPLRTTHADWDSCELDFEDLRHFDQALDHIQAGLFRSAH
ncbi:hypothetical protein [Sphingomonas sp. URHD0057]|uniref:hypothetical protein n=1 Tax=Sphingomonas sp. URHD0057 TaxID=1380389 RepID=UPI0004914250|nr:hypothetical protein [Sphingomonas sp. URHD0057]